MGSFLWYKLGSDDGTLPFSADGYLHGTIYVILEGSTLVVLLSSNVGKIYGSLIKTDLDYLLG